MQVKAQSALGRGLYFFELLWADLYDPQGPTGSVSIGEAEPFEPGTQYPVGSQVIYNGRIYLVTSAPQTGAPGTDPSFSEIEIVGGITGPTGPAGLPGATGPQGPTGSVSIGEAEPFEPGTQFPVGSLVLYNGRIYVVTSAPQTGAPGTDPSFSEVEIVGGITGPTGPQGLQGPPGASGPASTDKKPCPSRLCKLGRLFRQSTRLVFALTELGYSPQTQAQVGTGLDT